MFKKPQSCPRHWAVLWDTVIPSPGLGRLPGFLQVSAQIPLSWRPALTTPPSFPAPGPCFMFLVVLVAT